MTIASPVPHLQLRREGKGGDLVFLELYQDDTTAPNGHPSIRFHHSNKFWYSIEGRREGLFVKHGGSATLTDIHAGTAVLQALRIGEVTIDEGELAALKALAQAKGVWTTGPAQRG